MIMVDKQKEVVQNILELIHIVDNAKDIRI
jgi:hypothetical protein